MNFDRDALPARANRPLTSEKVSRRRTLTRLCSLAGWGATASWPTGLGSYVVGTLAPTSATATPALAPAKALPASDRMPRATTLHATLSSPWGLAFLPDGRMLVTQKEGTMVILSADGTTVLASVNGLPAVVAEGQGGLLDVAIDPDFARDPWVYWTYSEPGTGADTGTAGTAVARGRLIGHALRDVSVIFRQTPKVGSPPSHFGSRLAFRGDGTLFITLGDRKRLDPIGPDKGAENLLMRLRAAGRDLIAEASETAPLPLHSPQNLASHLGKVVRIRRDGTVPADNPKFGANALPEIWSVGHRNPQGAAIHPDTGELWITEHGPQGGDELNRVQPGGNHGWPVKSYGCPYGSPVGDACRIGGGKHAPTLVEPVSIWVPTSIAPSGLMFYTGDKFPEWRGNALFGALAASALWRVALNGNAEASRERLFATLGERIRCVRQGPDGWIYLLTDRGKLIRVDH
jgi:glucose/arabinose dehydrogenase